ncbi:MAG: WG repeat-containing protein [Clostridia bacterium]|nr:WG repeat-containing protein [Clostridia bacterium]
MKQKKALIPEQSRRAVLIAASVIAVALIAAIGFIIARNRQRGPVVDKHLTGGVWSTAGYEQISDVKSYDQKLLVFTDAETGSVGLMTRGGTVTEPAEHTAFSFCSDQWRSIRYTVESPRSEYALLVDIENGVVTRKQYHGLKTPARVPCWDADQSALVWVAEPAEPEETVVARGELALTQGLYPVASARTATARWGYIDAAQTLAIPLTFEKALDFSGEYAAVKKDGKWGYIDRSGVTVIPFEFDSVGSCAIADSDTAFAFENGMAPVCKDGKFGIIDPEGETVIPFVFEAILPGENGAFIAKRDGAWGTITVKKEALPATSQAPSETAPEVTAAQGQHRVKTAGSPLNLRAEASAEAAILGKLPNGTAVTVLRSENGWAYVVYGSMKGWVKAEYLEEAPPETTAAETTTATETTAATEVQE